MRTILGTFNEWCKQGNDIDLVWPMSDDDMNMNGDTIYLLCPTYHNNMSDDDISSNLAYVLVTWWWFLFESVDVMASDVKATRQVVNIRL